MNIPLWQVLPGLLTQWNKMYAVAQFGAATSAIQAATVDGELDKEGIQFIGQCQGMIRDIPHVDDLMQRIMVEAKNVSLQQSSRFNEKEKETVMDTETQERHIG
jgi:enoyl-[acyl-carrier protein] reductase II